MKKLIVCCDGTGNEISENISNVLKLYRVLRKTEKTNPPQIVYYDPGVGTLAKPDPWRRFLQNASMVFGLATGYGLDEKTLAAYEFLIDNYEEDDEIFLFGFSRGAHTVRVLAALIHKVGLLSKSQKNLAGSALTAYKQFSADSQRAQQSESIESQEDRGAQFSRIVSAKLPTIRFLGVWDTVASVITPRPDRFYLPSLQTLSFTRNNPTVKSIRHAVSIDERRRMFRAEPWEVGQEFMPNRYAFPKDREPQDFMQVWFSGVHADIGGGYPENESALSKYPLIWMIDEAEKCGLSVNRATVNQLAWGVQRKGSPFSYVAPNVEGPIHDSMNFAWGILEYLPKGTKFRERSLRKSFLGHYLPCAEPRVIPEGAWVHESVTSRISAIASYRPVNLPKQFQVYPMAIQRD